MSGRGQTKVRRAIGFPSRLGLDRYRNRGLIHDLENRSVWVFEAHTVPRHLLETSHCGRVEVNVAQDEAALCTELEGLYYAYSYDGGCLWPG